MAVLSKSPSTADQTPSSGLLGIKANQNLILDLDPSKYEAFLHPLIYCLRHSPVSCVADVNAHLHNIIETHDSLLTVFVHRHLAEKLKPIFSMLDQTEGVSESFTIPKQGGELLASKGKEKLVDDEDEEEEEYENEKLTRKSRDAKIDENLRVTREDKERENAVHEAEETLKTEKTLFPLWSMEHILSEAIDNPRVYWLEHVVSFEFENSQNSQLGLPITLKAFQFCCFDKIVNVPLSENGAY
ncbi:unnamed protein product [Lactuca saligna]|uniref:Uncharacterized protein n=1 Tax=Lactuca saligna TaxID=75948 RepID=A0AA36ECR6_LACSI|nr:unnamed protein product [Lactuca saligna]